MDTICSVVAVCRAQQVAQYVIQLELPAHSVMLLTGLSFQEPVVSVVLAFISLRQELSAQIAHPSSQCAQTALKRVVTAVNHHLHSLVHHAPVPWARTTIQ
jgi:hypothetical protein